MPETLTARFELKAAPDSAGRFSGLASAFGNVDQMDEVVARGAFRASLATHQKDGRMPAMLWSHDTREPIGVWEKIREIDRGLEAKGRLLLDVQRGREAHSMLKAGAIDGLSIGFRTVSSDTDPKTGIRTLTEVELMEVSLVVFPANARARVTAVKAAIADGRVPEKRDLEALLREAGLSRKQAVAFVAEGYGALSPDQPDDEIDALAASVRRAARTLNDLTTEIYDA